jgi:hypothetical protein
VPDVKNSGVDLVGVQTQRDSLDGTQDAAPLGRISLVNYRADET